MSELRQHDLPAALLRLVLLPARLMAARAALAELAALDGRELADIGLSRADLRDATALTPGADPTHFLAERAGDRRASAERLRAPPPSRRMHPRLAKTGS